MPYIQHDQEIEIVEPTKSLLLGGIEGEENVSEPFCYRLTLYSEKKSIAPADLLGKPVAVLINGETTRPIHGRVRRFALGIRVGELTSYHMEIVPWLWMLSLSSDCRHWEEKSVIDITKDIFERLGYTDFRIACAKEYPKREFCVQYNETHLDFLSRLWEEEGIYYFFAHTEREHKLVLADDTSAVAASLLTRGLQTAQANDVDSKAPDVATDVRVEHNVHPEKYLSHDFNFEHPGSPDAATATTGLDGAHGERYQYQEPYILPSFNDRLVRAQIEREESMHTVVYGSVGGGELQTGTYVDLHDAPIADSKSRLHVISTRLTMRMATYTAGESDSERSTEFVAVPNDRPYRPPRRTPKPRMQGIQTALVATESNEEITVDKYSRIRVHFHWDRTRTKSCWVRLSSTWAGAGMGFVQLPRSGDEVIVDFLNGDPDRPIIVGNLYNASTMPPLSLPGDKAKSGFKSRSLERGTAYNELWFNDTKDSEKVSLYAGKDYDTVVKNDCTRTVKEGKDELKVEKGSQTIVIHENRNTTIETGNEVVKVSQGDMNVEVSIGNVAIKAAAAKIAVEAMTGIELKVGANSIKIDQSGITISGTMVKVEGTAMTQIKAPMTQVNADGMLTLKGGMTMVN